MHTDDEFVSFVCEELASLGVIAARRMFGAVGLFLYGQMFALVSDGRLFIKVDKLLDGDTAFEYRRQGKMVSLRYVLVEDWDSGDELIGLIRERWAKNSP
jgi:DNA transformation protein